MTPRRYTWSLAAVTTPSRLTPFGLAGSGVPKSHHRGDLPTRSPMYFRRLQLHTFFPRRSIWCLLLRHYLDCATQGLLTSLAQSPHLLPTATLRILCAVGMPNAQHYDPTAVEG